MAANIEDFVTRLIRTNRKITFVFTEDFFNIVGPNGVMLDRYKAIRNTIKNVGHRKGEKAAARAASEEALFDVDIVVVKSNFTCFITSFKELADGPFGMGAVILGFGNDMVDGQKAKFLVESFLSEKLDHTMTVSQMLGQYRKRRLVIVAESPADLKRPSLEQIRNLRSQQSTILISPVKGPVVDCQVTKLADSENSNSFSTLLSTLCVKY